MASWDEDEGNPDDGHAPPWATRRPGPHPPAAAPDPARLLRPLSQAEDLLSRLDARAGAASELAREGLVARLALAEAAAWLTQAGLPTHPHDLGLRAAGLTGSWSATAAERWQRLRHVPLPFWGGSRCMGPPLRLPAEDPSAGRWPSWVASPPSPGTGWSNSTSCRPWPRRPRRWPPGGAPPRPERPSTSAFADRCSPRPC